MKRHYPDLYILRHGQTEWNVQNRLQGALDSPLTEMGHAQARRQRAVLEAENLDSFECWTSPQGRALETARIAVDGLVAYIEPDWRLSEIGVGEWAGKRREDLIIEHPLDESDESTFDLYERAPGGEGFVALRARCQGFLDSLDAPAVLVTHGITSRMLRVILQDLDIADLSRVEGGQGVVYHLSNGKSRRLE